jgi:hypothetical protein
VDVFIQVNNKPLSEQLINIKNTLILNIIHNILNRTKHAIGTVLKSNRKIVKNRSKIDIPKYPNTLVITI